MQNKKKHTGGKPNRDENITAKPGETPKTSDVENPAEQQVKPEKERVGQSEGAGEGLFLPPKGMFELVEKTSCPSSMPDLPASPPVVASLLTPYSAANSTPQAEGVQMEGGEEGNATRQPQAETAEAKNKELAGEKKSGDGSEEKPEFRRNVKFAGIPAKNKASQPDETVRSRSPKGVTAPLKTGVKSCAVTLASQTASRGRQREKNRMKSSKIAVLAVSLVGLLVVLTVTGIAVLILSGDNKNLAGRAPTVMQPAEEAQIEKAPDLAEPGNHQPLPAGFLQKMGGIALREFTDPGNTDETKEALELAKLFPENLIAQRVIAEYISKNGRVGTGADSVWERMSSGSDDRSRSMAAMASPEYIAAITALQNNPSTARNAEDVMLKTAEIGAHPPAVEILARTKLVLGKTQEAKELLALNAALADTADEQLLGRTALMLADPSIPEGAVTLDPGEAYRMGVDLPTVVACAIYNHEKGDVAKARGFYDVAGKILADKQMRPLLESMGKRNFVFDMQQQIQ